MDDFTKGFVCAMTIVVFGKIMYEKGKRKNKTEKRLGDFIVTIKKIEKEES